jgi:hypothetical protein
MKDTGSTLPEVGVTTQASNEMVPADWQRAKCWISNCLSEYAGAECKQARMIQGAQTSASQPHTTSIVCLRLSAARHTNGAATLRLEQ